MKLTMPNDAIVTVRAMEPDECFGARGLYWLHTLEISLDAREPPVEQADTLIHECIHALWAALNLQKRVSEETIATQLGTGLAELFGANPHLLHALAGALNHNVPIFKPKEK